jgi:hypothetical protein
MKTKTLLFSIVLFLTLLACGSTSKYQEKTQATDTKLPTNTALKVTSTKQPTTKATQHFSTPVPRTTEYQIPPQDYNSAIEILSAELNSNQTEISIEIDKLKFIENPVGNGIIIYYPDTLFFGVERYFIWIYLNGSIFVFNGATKDITPNLPWPRQASTDQWSSTNLSPYSPTEIIDYTFHGKSITPFHIPTPSKTPEVVTKFGYTTEEIKMIFFVLVAAEDKAEAESHQYDYYHQDVANYYNLTIDQLQEIKVEGLKYNWPMPLLP